MKRAAQIGWLAAWCALVTGLLEVFLFTRTSRLGTFIGQSREYFFMTPTANVALFAVLAAILIVLSLLFPAKIGTRPVVLILVTIGALGVLTHFGWMAGWARWLLALGMAHQVAMLASRYEEFTMRWVRRTVPVMAVLAVGSGAAGHHRVVTQERAELAKLGPARPGAPNVLIVLWDAVRASELGLYGYARPTTPHLDAFAATGVTFDHARSTASYTLPSHASLFTGRWAHQLSVSWTRSLTPSAPTMAEDLAAAGYRTGAFSANHAYVSWEFGVLRGFARKDDYVPSVGGIANSSAFLRWAYKQIPLRHGLGMYDNLDRRGGESVRDHFLDWLRGGDQSRPFFAFLNMYDAHDPYLPGAPFDTLFGYPRNAPGGERLRVRRLSNADPLTLNASDNARMRDQYDGAIARMDHILGQMLDTLVHRGVLENTIVVITSDHGEAFGEHRAFGHGTSVHPEEVRIPLVVVYPRAVPAGRRVDAVVSLRDVSATIADLAQVAGPGWRLPGRSLARFWSTAALPSDTVLTELDWLPRDGPAWFPARRGSVRSLTAWPYDVVMVGPHPELYDLSTDPGEHRDLSQNPAFAARRDTLIAALMRWRADAIPSKRSDK